MAGPPPIPTITPIITIDGVDGSGKSTFTAQLAAGLEQAGWPVALFSVDDFRRPVDWTRADRREVDTYYDDYYALDELERCLQAFRAGAPQVTIPVFDSRTETLAGERSIDLGRARVALIEGVFALRVPAAAAGLVIYVELDAAEARRRLIARDLARGRAREVIEHRLDARYVPAQERYIAACNPGGRADVVIDSATPQVFRATRRNLTRAPAELGAVLDRLLPPARGA
jgi:uridine kinase